MYLVRNDGDINLKAVGLVRVLQNVSNILRTIKGEIPLGREIGLENFIDQPINQVRGKLIKDVIEKIEKYEPRVKVKKVELGNETDKLKIQVKVEVLRIE